ncbi:hypothetical protein [Moraxella catarrhalis]|uniref:hypothetical protein n=1 Tax=Moraxella catarrhalis TaxID=480 RepID=UPI0018839DFF|nr:hypothetical protein [Moraxella catarrhalis]
MPTLSIKAIHAPYPCYLVLTAQAKPSHHAIGGMMAGMIIAHFPLIFPIFLFAQNRGK